MKANDYALCDGKIFKKAPDSQFSFVYCCGVGDFLMRSLANAEIANVLVSHIKPITSLLSHPSCRLIKPIKIMFNTIECLPPGTLFVISEKKFVKCKDFPVGCTPRTFVRYTYHKDQVPYPAPFVQGKLMFFL